MSSSVVHLALAAAAGLTLGAGATFALRPAPADGQQQQQRRKEEAFPVPSAREIKGLPTPSPSAGGQGFHGSLSGRELVGRVMDPVSIGPISDHLRRLAYTTAYDRRLRIPAWTAEHLTKEGLKGSGTRSESVFREDGDVPERFRAHLLDYFKSGYDRGHMVPAADAKQSQQAMSETFLLSNIAPQVGDGFNRHYWAYLEQFCRTLTTQFDDVYVFTVPLFLPKQERDGKWRVSYEMIAPQNSAPTIAVPTHFAKVLLTSRASTGFGSSPDKKEYSMGAFVLPNEVIPDEAPLTSFIVPVDAVENSAGLTLFPEQLKAISKPLCQTTKCQVVVRRFDDANKKLGNGGGGKGGRGRSNSA
ncbi:hypothetical protein BCR35DRAFT_311158 [Leucosporidium creatinivorum]|uniref:Endonuclease n=1 Tax=Leucosporidium creatinivorum TaxID=106004 RepID=A0A1Y2CBG1_9BASI|nr:hypothetical protein BCR35DRAFT_311158 [Leucosporidium creatinivorum]